MIYVKLAIMLAITCTSLTGCSLLVKSVLPTSSYIQSAGPNKYSIKVHEARGDAYGKWDEDAAKKCGDAGFTTLSQQFVKNSDGLDYLIGTFKCNENKNINKTPVNDSNETKNRTNNSNYDSDNIEKAVIQEKSSSQILSPQATVAQSKANMRKTPNINSDVIKKLAKGDQVKVNSKKGDWLLVELSSGEVGWCHQSIFK